MSIHVFMNVLINLEGSSIRLAYPVEKEYELFNAERDIISMKQLWRDSTAAIWARKRSSMDVWMRFPFGSTTKCTRIGTKIFSDNVYHAPHLNSCKDYHKYIYDVILRFRIIIPNHFRTWNLYLGTPLRSLVIHSCFIGVFHLFGQQGMPSSSLICNQHFQDEILNLREYMQPLKCLSPPNVSPVRSDLYNPTESKAASPRKVLIYQRMRQQSCSIGNEEPCIMKYLFLHQERIRFLVWNKFRMGQ